MKEVKKTMNGEELKKWRYENGLSQKEFAKRLGISDSTIKAWEKNQNDPTPQHYFDLKKELKKLGATEYEIKKITGR